MTRRMPPYQPDSAEVMGHALARIAVGFCYGIGFWLAEKVVGLIS
jgi:hypothetical protein